MNMQRPFFTVITATKNVSLFLPRLLQSLEKQTCRDFNIVIQDGMSTDGTISIAENYRTHLPELLLQSTPDTGIYDAWNNAVCQFQDQLGQWLIFLGADDALYASDVLDRCKVAIQEKLKDCAVQASAPPIRFAAGGIAITAPDGHVARFLPGQAENAASRLQAGGIPTPFPGLFIHRSVFEKHKFNPAWRIAGDYDFLCRTWVQADMGFALPLIVTDMREGGVSSQLSHASTCLKETRDIAQEHFGNGWTIARRFQHVRSCVVSSLYKYFPKSAPRVHNSVRRLCRKTLLQSASGSSRATVPFNPTEVPVFIISYNRLSYLISMVAWLESFGLNNIIIVDNNSTYPPLLEYLQTTPYRVERISENMGHLVVWKCGLFDDTLRQQYYIVTDPDVLPDKACPHDAVLMFYNMLQDFPDITKSGFSLKIDDLPVHFPIRDTVCEMEKRFWTKPTPDGQGYFAHIDTTFALYRPAIFPDDDTWFEGVRLAPPYIARHMPWYENPAELDAESLFYQSNTRPEASMWSVHDAAALKQENMRLREKVTLLEKQIDLLSRSWGNQLSLILFKVLRQLKHKLLGR